MKTELFRVEQQKDKTPGALLFFAALYDPGAVTSMHNLLAELKKMRGVAECKEHLDFSVLRGRILVCLANTPSLERLLNKFSKENQCVLLEKILLKICKALKKLFN